MNFILTRFFPISYTKFSYPNIKNHLTCSFGFSVGNARATNMPKSDWTVLYFCESLLVVEYI